MHAKLKAGDRVTVDLQNGSTLQGRFIDVGPDALSVSTPIGDRRLLPSEVVQVHRHRRGVMLGAIIGGGVGLAFGTMVGTIFANEGTIATVRLFGLTALGLGTGWRSTHWQIFPATVYQRTPRRARAQDRRRPAPDRGPAWSSRSRFRQRATAIAFRPHAQSSPASSSTATGTL